jgi:hypothetical protein
MLHREIIAICSEIHTKHINTLCGQNVELLDVKPGSSDRVSSKLSLTGESTSEANAHTDVPPVASTD